MRPVAVTRARLIGMTIAGGLAIGSAASGCGTEPDPMPAQVSVTGPARDAPGRSDGASPVSSAGGRDSEAKPGGDTSSGRVDRPQRPATKGEKESGDGPGRDSEWCATEDAGGDEDVPVPCPDVDPGATPDPALTVGPESVPSTPGVPPRPGRPAAPEPYSEPSP
jgi:hypothetical protein